MAKPYGKETHTVNSVVVYVNNEEKEMIRKSAFDEDTSMSKFLLDMYLCHKNCTHKHTFFTDWPDGGAVEICLRCGMSQHHWEQGQSGWIMIKDINKAKRELEQSINNILNRKEI